jgi:hypothetical protein
VKKPLNKFKSVLAGTPSRDIWIGALAALILLGAIVLGLGVFRNVAQPTLPAVTAWFGAGVNVVQSIFLLGTLVLAILTYRQARKTILQPLRTEVFKEQIISFRQDSGEVLTKTQLDLSTELGLIDLVGVNCQAMVDTYARVVLGYQYEWPTRDWENCKRKGTSFNIVELATAQPKVRSLLWGGSTHLPDYDAIIQPINGDKFAGWKNYNHPVIFYHDTFVDAQKRLIGLIASPVLPKDCQKGIKAILDYMNRFPEEMRRKIVDLSETLPGRVPTPHDFEWDRFKYVYQEAYREISDLTPAAEHLMNSIRGHLNPDDLQNV